MTSGSKRRCRQLNHGSSALSLLIHTGPWSGYRLGDDPLAGVGGGTRCTRRDRTVGQARRGSAAAVFRIRLTLVMRESRGPRAGERRPPGRRSIVVAGRLARTTAYLLSQAIHGCPRIEESAVERDAFECVEHDLAGRVLAEYALDADRLAYGAGDGIGWLPEDNEP
jgi:hypothetical protein